MLAETSVSPALVTLSKQLQSTSELAMYSHVCQLFGFLCLPLRDVFRIQDREKERNTNNRLRWEGEKNTPFCFQPLLVKTNEGK